VYPQGGTWIYDRANWCPGAEVEEYNKNISTQGGTEHKFDLNMQSYTSTNGGGNYMITAYAIEYGPSAFQLDASIEDILRPTSDPRYLRLNPNCGEPRIAIKNNGIENITSAYIEYGWEGMKPNRYMWNGLIQQGKTVQIYLPFIGNDAPVGTRFVCRFVWVNNRVDDYALNNKIASIPLTRTPVHQEQLYILLRTNNAASENYYTLTSADGKTILNKSNLKNNTIYRDTVKLEPGCYMLNLMDDGTPPSSYPLNEDGLGWWANTADGTGLFQI
ncbi:MAG: hypothetical protein IT244_06915, partial [Bacteroidia bacterium]|nr:hypothetical protein [Bacteroidia bacterium]